MIIGKLTSKKNSEREAGSWLSQLKDLPFKDDGYSLSELADYIGISKAGITWVFKGLIEPERRKVGRTFASFYSAEELRKLGKQYAAGKVYKIAAEE